MATTELKVLNSVLKTKDMAAVMAANVDDLFTDYKDVWTWIKDYNTKYRALPSIEIVSELFSDFDEVIVDGATGHYLDQLTDEYLKNEIERIVNKGKTQIKVESGRELLDNIQGALGRLNKFSAGGRDINIMDFEEAAAHYAQVKAAAEANGGIPGIPTGVISIDSAYPSGFVGGHLIVLYGWTGRGKSLLSEMFACRAYEMGHKPMIISLEMKPSMVRDRCYTILGSGLFQNSSLSMGDVDIEQFQKWSSDKSGEFIVPDVMGTEQITPNFFASKIEQHRPKFAVLDYAQLSTDNERTQDMTARMRNMSMQYKAVAEYYDIPIVLISSATPSDGASASKTPPRKEQVAWSRQLAFDADLMMAVHRHDGSNIIELVGDKNRHGPEFAAYLNWDINNGIIKEEFALANNL